MAFPEELDDGEEAEDQLGVVEEEVVANNSLTTNALTTNALVNDALQDPLARLFMSYVVRCALPPSAHIEATVGGQTYGFDGELGLASLWGDPGGSCTAMCRGWVSACVLARVNYLGQQVPISIRGNHSQLWAGWSEKNAYPAREATYYGDVFTSPQRLYACLSPGATSIPRVCGPSLGTCVATVVGSCDTTCDKPLSSGAFTNCRDMPRTPGSCHFPEGAQSYPGSITVFLQP